MERLVGQTLLNRYRVDAFLGRGGMAEVYKAWDRKRSVHVAIKLLNEDLAEDTVFLHRFAREARTIEILQHPHIVRFFGFEEVGRLAFMVMEYIDGSNLRTQLKLLERPLTLPEALVIVEPVRSALHYAHQMGIFHCDVKPANIFIERTGRVVLTDFGIARLTESATVTFSTPGTPAYMSPEQCRGREDLDARTDVYSLGITTYEMLTLDRPFKGDTEGATGSRGERVRWEQMHTPALSPRGVNLDISAQAEAAILRSLEKDPGRRQRGASEFYRDLSGAGTVRPASSVPWIMEPEAPPSEPLKPPPTHGPAEERVESRKPFPALGVIGAGILGIVVIVGLLAFALGRGRVHLTPTVSSGSVVIVATPTPLPAPATTPVPAASPTASSTVRPTDSPTPGPTATPTPGTIGPGGAGTRPADGAEMVYVPAGNFLMGSSESDASADPDERPQHNVYLSPYYIDRYEVTNAQFAAFVEATGYDTDAEREGWGWVWSSSDWQRVDGAEWHHPTGPGSSIRGRDDHPVTLVSWSDADAYCRWIGARLPTEAEWEKAARGTDGRSWPWGNFPDPSRANYVDSLRGFLTAASAFSEGASPYAALNMAGNVWEWVADWYAEDYYYRCPSTDPRNDVPGPCPHGGPSDQCKIMRGGSWRNDASKIRTANRTQALPAEHRNDFGFRCAMDAP